MDTGSMGQATEGPQASQFSRLPAEMRALRQWCIVPNSATDKAPRTVDGKHASVTDSTTWADFDTVCRIALERGWLIGFVFTAADPFACIDLDVVDAETQREKGKPINPDDWTTPEDTARFESIIAGLHSYTERSRSGKGFHIIVKGNIGKGRRRDGVEVYSQDRFIICTGNVHADIAVEDRQVALDRMVSQMPERIATERALTGDPFPNWTLADQATRDEGELGRLFCGDWQGRQYPSQSEADLALVKLLMPECDSPRECWETFLLSRLGQRPKAKRSGYAESTIALAIQHVESDAEQVRHGKALADGLFWKPTPNARHFRLLMDKDLERLPRLRWLVKRIIPDAGIGAIYGDSGTFKSFLTLDLLAHISHGKEWFGQRVTAAPAVYVPFEGQGGIPNRVKAWRLAQTQARLPEGQFAFSPADDIVSNIAVIMDSLNLREQGDRDKLVATLTENGWAGGVLCIDTLAHASAGIDENSSEMSEMIAIFRDLQHRLGGVILLIHHSGKDHARGMRGWSGLHAAMDFVIECQRDKNTGTREAQFVLAKVKDGSDGRAFGFEAVPVVIGHDEDGDDETSLTIVHTGDETDRSIDKTKPDAEQDSADDEFVWEWVKREVEGGGYPSGRSLEGQREKQMSQERVLTQKRLRDAIHRLRAASRLVDAEDKAPSGNIYMVAK